MRRKTLYLEERISAAYRMLNEDSIRHAKRMSGAHAFEFRAWIHRLIGVLAGEPDSIPRKHRRPRR